MWKQSRRENSERSLMMPLIFNIFMLHEINNSSTWMKQNIQYKEHNLSLVGYCARINLYTRVVFCIQSLDKLQI